ncbi:hypothetical protein CDAR_559671 [Caerostris darwini]|uniref:Uncharacterized protein n=1 Tax=Caerostris darwini TaxID=1538125 RepID=A0AAV4W1D8_9ARAC|nr:hypothetical protein CDAR_559671 [Caerostris darwini]
MDIEGKYVWAATSMLGLVFPIPDLGGHDSSFLFPPSGYLIAVVDVVVSAGKRRQLQETVFCYRCNLAKHVLSGMRLDFMRFAEALFPPGASSFWNICPKMTVEEEIIVLEGVEVWYFCILIANNSSLMKNMHFRHQYK